MARKTRRPLEGFGEDGKSNVRIGTHSNRLIELSLKNQLPSQEDAFEPRYGS